MSVKIPGYIRKMTSKTDGWRNVDNDSADVT